MFWFVVLHCVDKRDLTDFCALTPNCLHSYLMTSSCDNFAFVKYNKCYINIILIELISLSFPRNKIVIGIT